MINEENQSGSYIKNIIDGLATVISKLKTQLANIDEEYRKKCEEAKKELASQLEEASKQYGYWYNVLVPGILPQPAKKTRKPRTKKEDVELPEDEKVVDTEEEVTGAVQEEVKDEEAPEFDGAGFIEADNTPPTEDFTESSSDSADSLFGNGSVEELPEEPKDEASDLPDLDAEEDAEWEEKIESGEIKEVKPENNDPEWPEFPEEWK